MSNDENVIAAFGGADLRCETLLQALRDVVYERGEGVPFPSVVGVIRLLEYMIMEEQAMFLSK
jgi:hypothetical protein